jgi:hypothetical protein
MCTLSRTLPHRPRSRDGAGTPTDSHRLLADALTDSSHTPADSLTQTPHTLPCRLSRAPSTHSRTQYRKLSRTPRALLSRGSSRSSVTCHSGTHPCSNTPKHTDSSSLSRTLSCTLRQTLSQHPHTKELPRNRLFSRAPTHHHRREQSVDAHYYLKYGRFQSTKLLTESNNRRGAGREGCCSVCLGLCLIRA